MTNIWLFRFAGLLFLLMLYVATVVCYTEAAYRIWDWYIADVFEIASLDRFQWLPIIALLLALDGFPNFDKGAEGLFDQMMLRTGTAGPFLLIVYGWHYIVTARF